MIFYSCEGSKEDIPNEKIYIVDSQNQDIKVKVKLPDVYLDLRDFKIEEESDSIDAQIAWLIDRQYQYPESFHFYDSTNPQNYVSIVSGPRVLITEQEAKPTYFAQPSIRYHEIFPPADSTRNIVYEWKNKEFMGKTYFKTKYNVKWLDQEYYQSIYFISTINQSAIVTVVNKEDVNLDKYILNFDDATR